MHVTRWPRIGFAALILAATALAWAEEGTVSYDVRFDGVAEKKLRKALEDLSDTVALRETTPATRLLLNKRVERDQPRLEQELRARGFYGATVDADVDERVDPILVTFRIDPGEPYALESATITLAEDPDRTPVSLPSPLDLGLEIGRPVGTKVIVEAQRRLLERLRDQGYPFPSIAERKVLVDHDATTAHLIFLVAPGSAARFGTVSLEGFVDVDASIGHNAIPWQNGDAFNGSLLTRLQNRLSRSGLFSTVRVTTDEEVDPNGDLPVRVVVTERKQRTVGVGVGYKTDEGLGSRVWWEHRNLFHHGERLRLNLTASEIEASFEGLFRKPAFLRPDQTLDAKLRLAHDRPDAFVSRGLSVEALLTRVLSDRLEMGGGVALRDVDVRQFDETRHFSLLALPATLKLEETDEPFDPGDGYRLDVELRPTLDLNGLRAGFVKASTQYRHYLTLSEAPRVILAGRLRLGALVGASLDSVPADERFYAGGGGSIRGYPYQAVGPTYRDDPVGGRSLFEACLELRTAVTSRLGLVTFLEGGTVMPSAWPDFDEPVRWGAGVGARYDTPVGPVRFDVGFPLNAPDNVDDRFQVYLSLGHAF